MQSTQVQLYPVYSLSRKLDLSDAIVDGNGFIDAKELIADMRKSKDTVAKYAKAAKMIQAADKNGDDQVSYPEFNAMLYKPDS